MPKASGFKGRAAGRAGKEATVDRNTEALAPLAFYPRSQGIAPTRQYAMVAVFPTMLNRKHML